MMRRTYDDVMDVIGTLAENTNAAVVSTKQSADAVLILTNVVNEQSKKIQELETKLKDNSELLGGLSSTVEGIDNGLKELRDIVKIIQENEEITTTQQETIVSTARRRIYEILGKDELDLKKYFRTFVVRLYKDTRKYAGLGSKISRTRKGDFQRCINYIEAWTPSCGCTELKNYADRNAEARRKAKSLGYDV